MSDRRGSAATPSPATNSKFKLASKVFFLCRVRWGRSLVSIFLAHFKTNVVKFMLVRMVFRLETVMPNITKIDKDMKKLWLSVVQQNSKF